MSVALENTIYISDKAKSKVIQLMTDAGIANNPSYFLRVGVVGGGCSGLSYKLDFDNESKPMDQVFEDNGVKVVTDLKSFLYLVNTTLDFSDGLNGKGFYFSNPNASRTCGCGESFAV
ncbi:MAG TPA: iron-sulfur cluster assembly accessory protein [Chitinophagaceae bacterium]|nr:iron-sulfur cluster assembly accessory protein [Chitinophagaceae bacterium]